MITKTILLINSEPNGQEVMQACLSHLGGWQVLNASSPLEGLEYAAQDQPDAIVFDLSTSGMNFFTFLKNLRDQPVTQEIPIVLLAAGMKWLNIELLQQFQVTGVIDDLSDPIRLAQQIATLLNWDEEPQWIDDNSHSS
ncbi:MAG: response regulator [Oculatellaceae cyanobacterium bins.114]|nr:response regulator [Oculatellaceae cyanobacterium bins.114]